MLLVLLGNEPAIFSRTNSETVAAATDTVARALTMARVNAEIVVAAADSVQRRAGGARQVSEASGGADAVHRQVAVHRAVPESVAAAADIVTRGPVGVLRAILEIAPTPSDIVVRMVGFRREISEAKAVRIKYILVGDDN